MTDRRPLLPDTQDEEPAAPRKPTLNDHIVYSTLKILGALTSAAGFVVALVLIFLALFASNMDDNPYLLTNTFHVEQATVDTYSWPIYPTPWSGPALRPQPVGNNLNHYYECMYTAKVGNAICNNATLEAFSTCLEANYATQLNGCNVSSSLYKGEFPTQSQYGQCISRSFALGMQESSTFSACLQTELWPLFAWPQDINSPLFLGSYNWLLLSVVGYTLLIVFAMYTFWPNDFGEPWFIEYGKPQDVMRRLGFVWVWIPLVLSTLVLIASILVAFRIGSTGWPQDRVYPTTLSTNTLIVFATTSVFVYFVLELIAFKDVSLTGPNVKFNRKHNTAAPLMQAVMQYPYLARQGAVHKYEIVNRDTYETVYTPTLMNTWNIAYLTDALTFLGFVGATLQVDTSDAYNIFWGILFYRWTNVAAGYLMQEAYLPIIDIVYHKYGEQGPNPTQKSYKGVFPNQPYQRGFGQDNDPKRLYGLRKQALATHLAAVFFLISTLLIVFNPNKMYVEYSMVTSAAILFFIVPEAIKILFHLYMVYREDRHGSHALALTFLNQFIWSWDLIIRLILVCLLYWGPGSPGTRPFISDTNTNLTLAIKYLAI